jgi:pimeloyl-ACP methyl ester carboxylesterase
MKDDAPRGASGRPERTGLLRTPDGRRYAWSEWRTEDGRPLLFLHGSPGSGHTCPDVAATHEAGARLIAPDRPGFGDSEPHPGRTLRDDAADMAELLDHLGADGGTPVITWSSGGGFGLALAAHHPDRVSRLALVAADAPPDERPGAAGDGEQRAHLDRIRRDPSAARVGMMERAQWFADAPESMVPDPMDDRGGPDADVRRRSDVREMLLEMFRHAGTQGQAGWVDDSVALQLPWGFALADISQPVTVWFGAQDGLATLEDAEILATRIPSARLIVLPDDGHSLPMRHWATILETVLGAADDSLAPR